MVAQNSIAGVEWIANLTWLVKLSRLAKMVRVERSEHGLSRSGPYCRVRDLLATLTLNFSLTASYRQGVLLLRVEGRRE